VARMNIVDGIFTTQLGVKVSLATTDAVPDRDRSLHADRP